MLFRSYKGQLSARGESVVLKDTTGFLVFSNAYVGAPSLAQQYLRVTEIMYNPLGGSAYEFVELYNTGDSTVDLDGVYFSNGIDFEQWNPACDPYLDETYDAGHFNGKLRNKAALQRELGLPLARDVPLFGMVNRLVWQKGADVLIEAAPAIVKMGAQIVVHGEGERGLEQAFRDLGMRHPREIAVRIGFDERLNHRLVAGADAFLLPSRYEPCGLTQLHSMRYGTLPVAHATGGLAEWVIDANGETLHNGTATGFSFSPLTVPQLVATVERAIDAYRAPILWRMLQRHAMARKFDWATPALAYRDVYRSAAGDAWPRPSAAGRFMPRAVSLSASARARIDPAEHPRP